MLRTSSFLLTLPMGLALCAVGAVLQAQEPPAELVVQDAQKELQAIETAADALAVGDKSGAQRLIRRLDMVTRKLNSARDRSTALWKSLAAQHGKLGQQIVDRANGSSGPILDPTTLAALDSEVSKAGSEMRALSFESYGDAKLVADWQKRIAAFRERHATLAATGVTDRKLTAVGLAIETMAQNLDRSVANWAAVLRSQALEAELQSIMDGYNAAAMPKPIDAPIPPAAVESWTNSVKTLLLERLPADMAAVEKIAADPAAPKQRVSSARHWVGVESKRALEERLQLAELFLDAQVRMAKHTAEFLLAIDATNEHQVVNNLLREGAFEDNQQRLREGRLAVESAQVFFRVLAREASAEHAAVGALILQAEEHLKTASISALSSMRMPAAASTDPKLLEIAEATLKKPSYGVNPWERLVINMDQRRKEEWVSSVQSGTVRATITTVHYVWDEFQVTTAEQVGADYFLFYSRLKFFHSGGSTTPTGHWIVSDRFQSTQILKENIAK